MKLIEFKVFERTGEDSREAFTKGKPVSGEIGVETPKKWLYLTAHCLPLPEEDAKNNDLLAVYFEIPTIRKLEQKLQKSIRELADTLSAITETNLTISVTTYPDDPIADVKNGLSSSVSVIKIALSAIITQSQYLEQAIRDISRETMDLSHGSEQVAQTGQSVSEAISEQIQQLDQVSGEITDLSASIEEITANA
jgi:methyl-accepting chemotaxis protein